MVIIISVVKFLAVITLISAGVIHTFPFFRKKWNALVSKKPEMHIIIGLIALSFGVLNLIIYFFEIIGDKWFGP